MHITIWDIIIGIGTFIKFLFLNGLITTLCFLLYVINFYIGSKLSKKASRIILLIIIILIIVLLVYLWFLWFGGWALVLPCIIALIIIFVLFKK